MPFHDIIEREPLPRLADGAVHELMTALVRLRGRGLMVIDSPVNEPRGSGERELRLQGAVRTATGQVRVNAYLVRSRDGLVFGTSAFEERIGEFFEMQRTIAERILADLIEPALDWLSKAEERAAASGS